MKTEEIVTYKRKTEKKGMALEIFRDKSIFPAIAAIMISRVTAFGSMAPLGIAWYAANICIDRYNLIFAASVLGSFLMMGHAGKIVHIAALVIMFALDKLLPEESLKNNSYTPLLAASVLFLSGLAGALFSGTFYYRLITCFAESLAAGGMCLIFLKSADVIENDWKIANDEDSISIAIMAGAIVAGLQGISFFGIKAANVLSMYIILFTAYKGGIGISGAAGAAIGIIAGISQGDAPALTGVYGFMGLVSGIMNIFGKVGVVLSAAFANSLFTGYYNSSTIVLVNLLEIALAGLIFFFTPEKVLGYFEKFCLRPPVYDAAGGYIMRIKGSVGEALASLKNAATAISDAFMPKPEDNPADEKKLIKDRLVARVCEGCSLNKYCWTKNVKGTNTMFENVTTALFEESFEQMGAHITGRCVRGDMLGETSKELYGILKRENIIKNRVNMYARNFSDGWADFLEIISAKETNIANLSPGFASFERELCRHLAAEGIKSPEISMIMNDSGRYEITLRTSKEILFDIIPAASKITGRKMCVSDEYRSKKGFVLKLQESLKFDYDVSIITMNKHGSDLSGDNAEWFVTPSGTFYCLICDGMGSGERANAESKEVVSLFKTLVISGFSPQSALKIINGGMLSDSRRERCVGFDCLTVDLFTGKADFIKAGAVASIVKSGSETTAVRMSSIPLGVLDIKNVQTHSMFLEGSSYIVMMSDGVTDNIGDRKKGEECINSIMQLMDAGTSKEISDNIMMSAVAEGIPKDDMMVCAIKITGKDL